MTTRDKQILALARRAVNALGFAIQNSHNINAVYKYEKQSNDAMCELTDLLAAPYLMTHIQECGVLTGLIGDLKKWQLGNEHETITMERLGEATKAIEVIQTALRNARAEL